MSVPLYKRSVSKKEYYYNFKKIQKEIKYVNNNLFDKTF